MSDELKRILALICYVVGAVLLGYSAFLLLTTVLGAHAILLLCFITLSVLLLATIIRCRISKAHAERRRVVRMYLVLCSVLYVLVLDNLLFLHNTASQSTLLFFQIKAPNFIPFKSLAAYFTELLRGSTETQDILVHVLGNLALFIPLGFFLMTLFNLYKGKYYFPTVLAILVGVRALQYSLGFGRFDVDDILLNLLGAAFVFMVFDIQAVRRTMKKWYLGDRIRK